MAQVFLIFFSKKDPHLNAVEEEILRGKYIAPEITQKNIDNLRLKEY